MSRDGFFWVLGTMSGTSLDGVDAALLLTDGETIREFGRSAFRPYSPEEREIIRNAFGQSDGPAVAKAAEIVEIAHAELLSQFPEAALIGFHGQTLHHDPARAITVQAGNGQVLAEALARPVVWDFRSADVAFGGQGAPLAPFYHHALARHIGAKQPVVFLNIGGVANLTWVDPNLSPPETEGACLAFDTGPGNALIDDFCLARLGLSMDESGALAARGHVQENILAAMLDDHRYFSRMPPKSLDRNAFLSWSRAVADLSDADGVATLTAGTASAIAKGLAHCPKRPTSFLVTGGGRQNPTLLRMIEERANCPATPVETHMLDGDMLEAQAFAYLAMRVKRGLPTSAPGTTGIAAPIGGGVVSYPGKIKLDDMARPDQRAKSGEHLI